MAQQKKLWQDYVFAKQTLRELKQTHGRDRRTLKSLLDQYQAPKKTHAPRQVNLVVDALYFGQRTNESSWCAVVFRDPKARENLWWDFANTETTSLYLKGKRFLEEKGYTILSVTGDGFGGLRTAFSGLPVQMCHVHMERLVVKGTTRRPVLEASQVLLALVKLLHQTDSEKFKYYFKKYLDKYQAFLNEKTINPLTGTLGFTHEPVRQATMSLFRFLPYLFTFETDKNIPRTTNSIEGHFSHIRDITKVHRGLKRKQLEKVLNSIFLASTIAPSQKKLGHIL